MTNPSEIGSTRKVPIVRRIAGCNPHPHSLKFKITCYALVDEEDFEAASKFRWTLKSGYARTSQYPGKTAMYLHQLIFLRNHGTLPVRPKNVDHIDRDLLNCTRGNLREASQGLQSANTKIRKGNTSGYRGVYWYGPRKKWHARQGLSGRTCHLGYFHDKHEAGRAVNRFFEEHHPNLPIPNPDAELFL